MSHVYVIAADGTDRPCKVGVAIDPTARAKTLSCGSPRRLVVLGSVKFRDRSVAMAHEQAFHRLVDQFPNLRLNGEWVDVDAEMIMMMFEDPAELLECARGR